jgi:hypothetical protein
MNITVAENACKTLNVQLVAEIASRSAKCEPSSVDGACRIAGPSGITSRDVAISTQCCGYRLLNSEM